MQRITLIAATIARHIAEIKLRIAIDTSTVKQFDLSHQAKSCYQYHYYSQHHNDTDEILSDYLYHTPLPYS